MATKSEVKVTLGDRIQVVVTLAATGLISAWAYRFIPLETPTTVTLVDKIIYTLRWQVLSFCTLLVGVQVVAFVRLFTPAVNPLDKAGDPYVDVYNRCLQNTLEQLVLNVPGQLILSTFLDNEGLKAIPYLVGLFIVGRILFFLGYPFKRAAGFAMTYLPTLLTYGLNLYYLIMLGASYRLGKK